MRLFLFITYAIIFFSCSKSNDGNILNDFPVDNSWQCEINGKLYTGTIDTAFYIIYSGYPGTTVFVSGTSADGKANFAFKFGIDMNSPMQAPVDYTHSFISFDTASEDRWQYGSLGLMDITVEGFNLLKFKGGFSGTVTMINGSHQSVTNGKLSFDLGKGNGAAKFADFHLNTTYLPNNYLIGPTRLAEFKSNTLIIEGFSFPSSQLYELQVRTGAAIKPGTYQSRSGDVGFQLYPPSIVSHYVSDSLGDMQVNITSVVGNIVTGTFDGIVFREDGSGGTAQLQSGHFKCRVKNYQPAMDSVNQWKYDIDNSGQFPFFTGEGNILSASLVHTAFNYKLSINGTSDNGKSIFHLNQSSNTPFVPGIYPVMTFIDSCYFNTPDIKFYNSNSSFYVRIDSINTQRVVGGFYGVAIRGYQQFYGSGIVSECRKGYFRANF